MPPQPFFMDSYGESDGFPEGEGFTDLGFEDPSEEFQRARAWVEVDLDAIQNNVLQLRRHLPKSTDMMAIVKADGYGHGSLAVAQAAIKAGVQWLGVATVGEGVELRRAGIDAPILVLEAVSDQNRAITARDYQLGLTIAFTKQAVELSELFATAESPLMVHLNIDTGMSRLGVDWTEAAKCVRLLSCLPGLELKTVYSHLATADEPDDTMVHEQHRRLKTVLQDIRAAGCNVPIHFSNSAGAIAFPGLNYDMVRIGLALYGIAPATHLHEKVSLQPAMSVFAKVTQIRTLPAGRGISYGHRFVTQRETKVATVGIGYADGVPRALSGRLSVSIAGRLAPQVGTITMDQLLVDVTDLPDVRVGNTVTLLGRDNQQYLTAQQWASMVGSIPWEVVCGFRQRLPRVYKQKDSSIPLSPAKDSSCFRDGSGI